jgi:hypothetical protein
VVAATLPSASHCIRAPGAVRLGNERRMKINDALSLLQAIDQNQFNTSRTAVAEMERVLLVERTQPGLARAKAAGRVLGRPSTTSAEQRTVIVAEYAAGVPVSELARRFSVSRANILGIVKPAQVTPENCGQVCG